MLYESASKVAVEGGANALREGGEKDGREIVAGVSSFDS